MLRANVFVVAAAAALLVAACSMPDIGGSDLAGEKQKGGGDGTSSPSSQACVSVALAPTDPGTFPKCACAKGGSARCVPKDKVPTEVSAALDTCTEGGAGYCVPDKLVASGGAAPKSCKSAFGDGRCMGLCVPQVAQNASLLNRGEGDVCDDDERCVPCLNPLKNNEPTGVCEIGKPAPVCTDDKKNDPAPSGNSGPTNIACPYTGPPIVDPATFPTCPGVDGVHCVPGSMVPASAQAMLATCSGGFCAPDKSIAAGGQYVPKTCTALAGAEGRCLNAGLPPIAAQKAQLSKDVCDANELCAPCYNPIDGKPTGACNTVSCDAPKQAAKTFTGCCTDQGATRAKCVPTTIIPQAEQGNLDDDNGTCKKGAELCVPNEMLLPNFKGVACSGSTLLTGKYSGVCLSSCLHFGFIQSLGISKGSCMDGFKCAPCTNPLTGQPTGAPGCPGT